MSARQNLNARPFELINHMTRMTPPASAPIDLDQVPKNRLPQHVAIIMDGNGRWAKSRLRPRIWGHSRGVDSVRAVVERAGELGIKVLTLFAFSEENWGRPTDEVSGIMQLLDTYIVRERTELMAKNVQFRTSGDLSRLPPKTRTLIEETTRLLSTNSGLILNIALSYSGRSEIVAAAQSLARRAAAGEIKPEQIDQTMLGHELMTGDLPDPDLLIRTSGELRISNFLLWQLAYAELYFTETLWPDFRKSHFEEAIRTYLQRERRYGLVITKNKPVEQVLVEPSHPVASASSAHRMSTSRQTSNADTTSHSTC